MRRDLPDGGRRRLSRVVGLALVTAPLACALGTTGEDVYRDKCSLCHDGGAGDAPKIGDRDAWVPRIERGREALFRSALLGVPDSAMGPKGGYPQLSTEEIGAALDYLVGRSGGYRTDDRALPPAGAINAAPPSSESDTAVAPVDDERIRTGFAEALSKAQGLSARAIRYEVAAGVITLRGMVKDADQVHRAEALARSVSGVRAVDNKLIAASVFQWD